MSDDRPKVRKSRVLRFAVTSALLVGPAAQGCQEPETTHVNTPAPEPEPLHINTPAQHPPPSAGDEAAADEQASGKNAEGDPAEADEQAPEQAQDAPTEKP